MITFENCYFKYQANDAFALEDINLKINDGEFIGIIGASGAGKTSLTLSINGLIPHNFDGDFYGFVRIDGIDTVETRPEELSVSVGSVFQDIDGQLVTSIVEDEILFGLENFGVAREEIEGRISFALKATGIEGLRKRSISTLSGGQKQKVAIASAIALRPQILVLDEPTGELDPQSSRMIFSTLKELNEQYNITVIVVEQKIMLLSEFAQRLIVMEKGRIIKDGEVREALGDSDMLVRAGVNCPRIVSLCDRLRQQGLYEGITPTNLIEAEKMLKEVLL